MLHIMINKQVLIGLDRSHGFLSVGLWFRYFSLSLLSTVYGRYLPYTYLVDFVVYRTCHFRVRSDSSSFLSLSNIVKALTAIIPPG